MDSWLSSYHSTGFISPLLCGRHHSRHRGFSQETKQKKCVLRQCMTTHHTHTHTRMVLESNIKIRWGNRECPGCGPERHLQLRPELAGVSSRTGGRAFQSEGTASAGTMVFLRKHDMFQEQKDQCGQRGG